MSLITGQDMSSIPAFVIAAVFISNSDITSDKDSRASVKSDLLTKSRAFTLTGKDMAYLVLL